MILGLLSGLGQQRQTLPPAIARALRAFEMQGLAGKPPQSVVMFWPVLDSTVSLGVSKEIWPVPATGSRLSRVIWPLAGLGTQVAESFLVIGGHVTFPAPTCVQS